jgi:hypothetical protein
MSSTLAACRATLSGVNPPIRMDLEDTSDFWIATEAPLTLDGATDDSQ